MEALSETKKLSFCPTHGKTHALSSGLCTYSDCVKKVIWHLARERGWKFIDEKWSFICRIGADDDFVQFVIMELVREEKTKGKKPTLNPHWLIFRIKKYLSTELRKSNVSPGDIPNAYKKAGERQQVYINAVKEKYKDVIDELIYVQHSITEAAYDVSTDLELKQLAQMIREKFGDSVSLFLEGKIKKGEYYKLSCLKPVVALQYVDLVKEESKFLFENGYWADDVDKNLEDFREKNKINHDI